MKLETAAAAAVFALVLCVSGVARADVLYVDVNGGTAYETIKSAVQVANEGDTIYVAAGTYSGEDNREISFDVNLSLIGQGTVIIDCEGLGRAILLTSSSIDHSTVIRDFTIINGAARAFANDGGGGISCQGAAPIIQYCTFTECDGEFGGAIRLTSSNAIVQYCRFTDNTGSYGGAIATLLGSPFFDMVHVWGNAATASGGGIRLYNGTPRLNRLNVILNSISTGGGAIEIVGDSIAVEITNCIVAFSTQGCGILGGTTGTIEHCIVFGNAGGGVLPAFAGDNLFVDPYFCDVYAYSSEVCDESWAFPTMNDWDAWIGYVGVGRYAPCVAPVEELTWGRVKALYR
ncbi:right-handed parallel beta-helix repeat-containing protein [bacterium]|nr:right-handed parallel beta-helix repeat-containing protein [bacterium]